MDTPALVALAGRFTDEHLIGSDASFSSPSDVQLLALALLAVFLFFRRVLTSRPAFHTRRTDMATKTDFTAQEWEVLRDVPHLVMLSVATAGSSGPIGSIKEAFAPLGAIMEAAKGNDALLRAICDRAELQAGQEALRTLIKAGGDAKTLRDRIQNAAADKAAAANAILKQKGSPEDLRAYRQLLTDVADRTANAAKEGSFLGFGGERVSEGERAVIKRISEALEIARA
jgi:hypothetical protein